jgi:hypothetical protein
VGNDREDLLQVSLGGGGISCAWPSQQINRQGLLGWLSSKKTTRKQLREHQQEQQEEEEEEEEDFLIKIGLDLFP